MVPLFERFRPSQWSDVVGQDKVIAKLNALRQRGGLSGRAYFISGSSGTGKTTIARLIASEVASPDNIEELDVGECTIAKLEEIERGFFQLGMFAGDKRGKAFIIEEVHGIKRDPMRRLLKTIEGRLPPHVVFIFTTTTDGADTLFEDCIDAGPFASRCLQLPLSRRDLAKPFAERARMIAQQENMDGKPIEKYIRLFQDNKNNFRAVLNAIEAGEMLEV